MDAWTDLAERLRNHYPDDWAERYRSYKDGTNVDLQTWRGLGGEQYVPAPRKYIADPALIARNERVRAANRAGVPLPLMAERFGLSTSAISEILGRFGERASR